MSARLVTAVSCVSGGAFAEGAARTCGRSGREHKPPPCRYPRRDLERSDPQSGAVTARSFQNGTRQPVARQRSGLDSAARPKACAAYSNQVRLPSGVPVA